MWAPGWTFPQVKWYPLGTFLVKLNSLWRQWGILFMVTADSLKLKKVELILDAAARPFD